MAFEVIEGDEHIRVHHRPADLGFLHIFPVNGHQRLVRPLQAVGDQHMAACGKRRESVLIGRVQMIQRILPSAHIQGIAVGKEGLPAQFLHSIHYYRRVVGPQESQVPRLSKMHLDSCIFPVKINLIHPRRQDQPLQLLRQIL